MSAARASWLTPSAGMACALVALAAAGCEAPFRPDTLFKSDGFERTLASARAGTASADSAALNLVGVHYYVGAGVARDFAAAGHWFERAARLGNADAQRNLGVLYLRGLGVRQDDFLAFAWFTEAAAPA